MGLHHTIPYKHHSPFLSPLLGSPSLIFAPPHSFPLPKWLIGCPPKRSPKMQVNVLFISSAPAVLNALLPQPHSIGSCTPFWDCTCKCISGALDDAQGGFDAHIVGNLPSPSSSTGNTSLARKPSVGRWYVSPLQDLNHAHEGLQTLYRSSTSSIAIVYSLR